jgi:hypothetical protein
MKAPILKRVAHWARHDPASKDVSLGSSQVHELIAAVLGFNTHAAFSQSTTLDQSTLIAPALVQLDPKLAQARCRALDDSLPAALVVERLTRILEKASTHELVFASNYHADTQAFVRHAVLAQPRMAGVVDDVEARVQASVREGWADNDILRMMADNSGPVHGTASMTTFQDGRGRIRASGEYEDAQGESGSYDLDAMFEHQTGLVYVLKGLTVDFRPGEFEDLVMDEFTGYDHG